ncbi:MAG: nuclease, partial [Chloroflexota bacterium]
MLRANSETDPLMAHIARLGDQHERIELESLLEEFGTFDATLGVGVALIDRVRATPSALAGLHQETMSVLRGGADVVYQAGFFDGEFHGYADFLERADGQWVVSDAKLARQVRPKALLQLGAYADQLERAGIPLADHARLRLGDGTHLDFPLSDIAPVFRERRSRLRELITEHLSEQLPAEWGDARYVACGRCADCQSAIEQRRDVLLTAGVRMDQRTKL